MNFIIRRLLIHYGLCYYYNLDCRDGGISKASAPRGSSPVSDNLHQTSAPIGSSLVSENPMEATAAAETATSGNWEVEASDEFDPRGPVSGVKSCL